MLDKLQNLSRWLWENKAPSQLPAEITQSAQGLPTRAQSLTLILTVLRWVCVLSTRVNWQQMVNTDQDKDQALTLPPPLPTVSKKVLCYHGDTAKARASHCWAESSRVIRTPSQRSDVTQASHSGHHSPAFSLWPGQALKQIERLGKGGEGCQKKTKLNIFTQLFSTEAWQLGIFWPTSSQAFVCVHEQYVIYWAVYSRERESLHV